MFASSTVTTDVYLKKLFIVLNAWMFLMSRNVISNMLCCRVQDNVPMYGCPDDRSRRPHPDEHQYLLSIQRHCSQSETEKDVHQRYALCPRPCSVVICAIK